MPLLIDMEQGESVQVGDALVRIERKSGTRVRLSIAAPLDISIQLIREPQERPAQNLAHECPQSSRTQNV